MSNSSTRSATPQHEQHAELKKWIGYDFDPNIADTERLTQQLAALPKAGLAGPPPDALRGDSRDAYRKVTNCFPRRRELRNRDLGAMLRRGRLLD
jgi:hypothetical protein